MKYALALLLFLLPAAVFAVEITNCDREPPRSYKILILTDGTARTIELKKFRQTYADDNDLVSFQVEDVSPVMVAKPKDGYCLHAGELHQHGCCQKDETIHTMRGVMVR